MKNIYSSVLNNTFSNKDDSFKFQGIIYISYHFPVKSEVVFESVLSLLFAVKFGLRAQFTIYIQNQNIVHYDAIMYIHLDATLRCPEL